MKITDVRTVLLTGRNTLDPFLSEARLTRSAAFVEILTDCPLTGLGETYAGYFCPEMVPEIVSFFRPILLGQDVEDIPQLWERMYHCGNFWCRVGLGAIVLNGIEAALWDLKGKQENLPVYQLLGGAKHASLPCYATGGPSNYPLDRLAAKLDFYQGLGFRAAKLGAGEFTPQSGFILPCEPGAAADLEARKLSFVRSHVGPEFGIMLDGHMGNSQGATWDLETATAVVKAVEPFGLTFFEEPLHYSNLAGYRELCARTSVPIAGGECLTTLSEWSSFIEQDCFDIGQPDASFTGGLTEFMRVASLLGARDRKIATHAWGAGGSLMQNLHCGFACDNTAILEIPPAFAGLHADIVGDSFLMENGRILPPRGPGLGITLTRETRAKYPFIPGSGEFNSVPGKILQL